MEKKRIWVARLTNIFRDATEVKEINVSDIISTISDITNLTLNTDNSESSFSLDRSNTEEKKGWSTRQKLPPTPTTHRGGKHTGKKTPEVPWYSPRPDTTQ